MAKFAEFPDPLGRAGQIRLDDLRPSTLLNVPPREIAECLTGHTLPDLPDPWGIQATQSGRLRLMRQRAAKLRRIFPLSDRHIESCFPPQGGEGEGASSPRCGAMRGSLRRG